MASAACGGGAAGIGQAASAELTPQVQQIRAAATSGDAAATAATLAELRRTVADLRQRGELSDADAAEVLAAAAEVEEGTGVSGGPAQVAPTSSSPPAAQTPSTSAPVRSGGSTTQPASNGDGKGGGKGGDKGGRG